MLYFNVLLSFAAGLSHIILTVLSSLHKYIMGIPSLNLLLLVGGILHIEEPLYLYSFKKAMLACSVWHNEFKKKKKNLQFVILYL